MDDTDNNDFQQLVHDPLSPARHGSLGECMYSSFWSRFACLPVDPEIDYPDYVNCKFDAILEDANYPYHVGQREASVAASFVTWLGTNIGTCFRGTAKKMGETLKSFENGFLAAWAIQNSRKSRELGGLRYLEAIISDRSSGQREIFNEGPHRVRISSADLEVVEAILIWLGSAEGQSFMMKCDKEIEALDRESRNVAKKVMLLDIKKRADQSSVEIAP